MTAVDLARIFVLAFIACCIASAALQVVAWTRHGKEGAPMNVRALWNPEGHFDEIGLRQVRVARRLLSVGAIAYLCSGFLLIASRVLSNAG